MKHVLASVCLLVVVVAGCSQPTETGQASTGGTTTVTTTTTRTTTTAPTSTPPKPRTLRLGDTATAGCVGTDCDLAFTLKEVTECTGDYAGAPPPSGTERKLLWVEVQTGTRYQVSELPSGAFTQFKAINVSGVTGGRINPSTYWTCAPEGSRMGFGDEDWLPNQKYGGAIEVYLPVASAKVVNAQGFWEWQLG